MTIMPEEHRIDKVMDKRLDIFMKRFELDNLCYLAFFTFFLA